jgi:transcription factor Sp8
MRSDHLAKHVKTHNGSNPGSVKKGSSESCSDSEEQNTSDLHQSSPGNNNNNNNASSHNNNNSNNTLVQSGMDMSGLHAQHQHNTMILTPHQINAPLLHHHHHHQHHHHAPSPGLEHANQLDIKPGIV